LVLGEQLILLQLCLYSLGELFPVERTYCFLECLGIQLVHLAQCVDVELDQNVVLDGFGEFEPGSFLGSLVSNLRELGEELVDNMHLLDFKSGDVVGVRIVGLGFLKGNFEILNGLFYILGFEIDL